MRRSTQRRWLAATIALTLSGVSLGGWSGPRSFAITPNELLTEPINEAVPDAAQRTRGQYLVAAGDCMSCHLRPGGEPFAGGLGLKTPFGVIYSANITPDPQTGIGNWTSDQFYRAMHDGKDDEGEHLYPAFPYPWFQRVSRADDDAMLVFLKTVPAVRYTPPANELPFVLKFRPLLAVWNLLFLPAADQQTDPNQSAAWNRGAYLVRGLGHCGGCHTAKGVFGNDNSNRELQGGKLDNWVAPDLTGDSRTGLGTWSADDIAEYLRTGRNAHAAAGGAMADVVTYSTSLLSEADQHAIATYLKAQAARTDVATAPAQAAEMQRGAAIYSDACSSCHLQDGVGQPRLFPPLGHNAMLQQADATGLEHLIMAGSRTATTASRPSPLNMPSFAWKLSDQQIADVGTFIRNSWGNRAAPLTVAEVSELRRTLGLQGVRLTDNSGDQQ
ncbi:MAG: cytochrome c [Steroidobacteraceae bacterium]